MEAFLSLDLGQCHFSVGVEGEDLFIQSQSKYVVA